MAWRRTQRALLLAVCALPIVGAQCGGEDEQVKALGARRDLLAGEWRPKAEFWEEVERKGAVVRQARAITDEIAAQNAEIARLEAVFAELSSEREAARAATRQAQELRRQRASELQRLEVEWMKREQRLQAFETRRRAGTGG